MIDVLIEKINSPEHVIKQKLRFLMENLIFIEHNTKQELIQCLKEWLDALGC